MPSWFWPTNVCPPAGDLLIKLLQCDPLTRLTAAEALLHPWCRDTQAEEEEQQAAALKEQQFVNEQQGGEEMQELMELERSMSVDSSSNGRHSSLLQQQQMTPQQSFSSASINRQLFDEANNQSSSPPSRQSSTNIEMQSPLPTIPTYFANNNIATAVSGIRPPPVPVSLNHVHHPLGFGQLGQGQFMQLTAQQRAALAAVDANRLTNHANNLAFVDRINSNPAYHPQQSPPQQQQQPGWQYNPAFIQEQQRQKEAAAVEMGIAAPQQQQRPATAASVTQANNSSNVSINSNNDR